MQFILSSHGPLAKAMKESMQLITGKFLENVHVICIDMETSKDDVFKALDDMVKTIADDEPIMAFTDLFGGSINRFICEYASTRKMHIIAGMNLPMLLDAILSNGQTTDIDAMVPTWISIGQTSIIDVLSALQKGREEDEL